jgi:uncharacterized membrane protein
MLLFILFYFYHKVALIYFLHFNFFCSFRNQGSAFDFGELEEAIVLQGIKIRNDEGKARMLINLFHFSMIYLFFLMLHKHITNSFQKAYRKK